MATLAKTKFRSFIPSERQPQASAFILLLSLLIIASACSSTDKSTKEPITTDKVETLAEPPLAPSKAEPVVKDTDATQNAEAQKEAEASESIEDQLAPEDFEEGFCIDDIYATYLIKQYAANSPAQARKIVRRIKASGTKRRSRHSRHRQKTSSGSKEDLEAMHYARVHLSGPTMPYFGGLPVVVNEQVDFWIRYFKTAGRKDFMRWLVRGESLKKVVQPVLQKEGIPIELFYLAMVESGFSNNAYSSARATGTWQFMKGTAQLYGLKIDRWVDERRDPVKSTLAAANYLRDLYVDLGDWNLAMAAYNAGPGKIRKAIRRSGQDNFWNIAATGELSQETINYVPKVMAAILLAANTKSHGFDFTANPRDEMPNQEVILNRPVRLEDLAKNLGCAAEKLKQWNPELVQDITPPSKKGYSLRLAPPYAEAYPSVADKLSVLEIKDIHIHVVRRGETLSRIAKRYKVGVKQILTINPKLNASNLVVGHSIAIPVPSVVVSG